MTRNEDLETNRSRTKKDRIIGDKLLVRAICGGCADAWQQFLETYSGLIYGVVRRHLYTAEEEDVRSVYVGILKYLYDGHIEKYEGRAPLASWLVVVSKCLASDYLRKINGRYRPPKGYEDLTEFQRETLKLFYAERLSMKVVIQTLRWSGYS